MRRQKAMGNQCSNLPLQHGAAFSGAAGAGGRGSCRGAQGLARAAKPDPLITEVQDWNRYLGEGVPAHPYGKPVQIREACRAPRRRMADGAAVNPRSTSRRFMRSMASSRPSALAFERHHGGIADIDPAKHRLMINGLVDKPLVFTMDDLKRFPGRVQQALLPRVRGQLAAWNGRARSSTAASSPTA